MRLLSLCLLSSALACAPNPDEPNKQVDVAALIRAACESSSEVERLELLQDAHDATPSGTVLRFELFDVIDVATHFAHPRSRFWQAGDQERAGEGGYLSAFFTDRVWPSAFGDVYPPEPRVESPLHPLWALYRGRMMIWQGLEHGLAVDQLFAEGRTLLAQFEAAYPTNPITPLYLGEGRVWPIELAADAEAPEWAILQREAMVRLQQIVRFWIDERQATDGQFGGGWGDDVELWRRWTPLLLGYDLPDVQAAQRLLAEGIFALPRLTDGYTAVMTDVEHSSEDSSDPLTALLLIDPEDVFARAQAERLIPLAREVWMQDNARGERQFRSTYFTATAVDNSSARACDTTYHVRALQPLLHLWQNGHQASGALLEPWLRTWVAGSMRATNGKPAGIVPSSLRFPSGDAGGSRAEWWNPGCHITDKTYAWPRAVSMMTQALVIAARQTEDQTFLAPIEAMADFWRQNSDQADRQADEGSTPWIAARLPSLIGEAISRWRQATGDTRFDDLLDVSEPPYARANRRQDDALMLENLRQTAAGLGLDWRAWTDEVLFTDRAFKFHRNYADRFRAQPSPRVDTKSLFSLISGAPRSPEVSGGGLLRWNGPVNDLAVWVKSESADERQVLLYAFPGSGPRAIEAKITHAVWRNASWELRQGDQRLASGSGETITVSLPRGAVHHLSLRLP